MSGGSSFALGGPQLISYQRFMYLNPKQRADYLSRVIVAVFRFEKSVAYKAQKQQIAELELPFEDIGWIFSLLPEARAGLTVSNGDPTMTDFGDALTTLNKLEMQLNASHDSEEIARLKVEIEVANERMNMAEENFRASVRKDLERDYYPSEEPALASTNSEPAQPEPEKPFNKFGVADPTNKEGAKALADLQKPKAEEPKPEANKPENAPEEKPATKPKSAEEVVAECKKSHSDKDIENARSEYAHTGKNKTCMIGGSMSTYRGVARKGACPAVSCRINRKTMGTQCNELFVCDKKTSGPVCLPISGTVFESCLKLLNDETKYTSNCSGAKNFKEKLETFSKKLEELCKDKNTSVLFCEECGDLRDRTEEARKKFEGGTPNVAPASAPGRVTR